MYFSFVPPAYPVDYAILTAVVFIIATIIAVYLFGRKHADIINKAGTSDMSVQEEMYRRE